MSLPHSRRESIEKRLNLRKQEDDINRLSEAAGPLVEAWGIDKYLEWCDVWISDIMTVDEIILTMYRFYPEQGIPAAYGLPD